MSITSLTSTTTKVSVSPFLASYFDSDDNTATTGALRRPEFLRAIHTLQDDMRSETSVGFLKHSQAMKEATNQRAVITAYNQVLIDLTQRRDEWQAFLRSCCALDLFDQAGGKYNEQLRRSRRARRRWQNQLVSDAQLAAYQYESVLTAKLASLPVDQLKAELVLSVNRCLEEFNRHCLTQLIRLVELEVFGIAQWFDGNCQYCFFRRHVSSDEVDRTVEEDWNVERQVATGKTTMHLFCHEHHLIDAQQSRPDAAGIPIPEKLDQLLAETPLWIFDYLQLITGTMIKENVVEEIEHEETWQQVEEIPRMHFDPALVIGPFVLLAWGPRDEEQLKLVPPRDGISELLINKYRLAAAGAVVGVGGMVLWSGLHSMLLTLFGYALIALGGYLAGAIDRVKMREKESLWVVADVQMVSALTCSLCLVLAIPSFAIGGITVPLFLLIVAAVCAAIYSKTRTTCKRRLTPAYERERRNAPLDRPTRPRLDSKNRS